MLVSIVTPDSINTFINLPKSKNEIDLSLEQMRAMDSNIPIGVTFVLKFQ